MKNALLLIILFTVLSPSQAADFDSPPTGTFLVDVILMRPGGLMLTVVGSALFVGLSPLTALAAVSPPHDAFDIAAELLVLKPANFTFNRPVGEMGLKN